MKAFKSHGQPLNELLQIAAAHMLNEHGSANGPIKVACGAFFLRDIVLELGHRACKKDEGPRGTEECANCGAPRGTTPHCSYCKETAWQFRKPRARHENPDTVTVYGADGPMSLVYDCVVGSNRAYILWGSEHICRLDMMC